MKFKIISIFLILLCSCAVEVENDLAGDSSSSSSSTSRVLSEEDIEECATYRSWQNDYWKSKEYRRCIHCNQYMLDLNCDLSIKEIIDTVMVIDSTYNDTTYEYNVRIETYPVNYYNLARSFIEMDEIEDYEDSNANGSWDEGETFKDKNENGLYDIGGAKPDSAFWALDLGLNAKGEDEILLELGAYIAKESNNQEQRIYYLERALEANEYNQRALEQLSDIYRKTELYDEQVEILDKWLEIRVCDEDETSDGDDVCMPERKYDKAIGEKKRAYEQLGYETSDVDLEKWEADKTNLVNGIIFLRALEGLENLEDLIYYADEMLRYDDENITILTIKAEAQENIFDYEAALETYEELYDITGIYSYAIDVSKIYATNDDYESAYKWSEEAIDASTDDKEKGESLYQRGETLLYLARSCEDKNINFWDKIVYQLALEDYIESYNLKNYSAGTRKVELQEQGNYYLPKATDWALSASGVKEVSPSERNDKIDVPLKSCYSFIKRRVVK